jgi:multiple sugar transport system substrate-binding protein
MTHSPHAVELIGLAWDHTRGYVPLVAAAQRFGELHPDVTIAWRKRSLKAFGDQPLLDLAQHFDLLVIDHPFIGYAAAHGMILPLDEYLPSAFLADQEDQSVGASYASYHWEGRQWALAIDAAAPVSAWRPDLLQRTGVRPPETWDDLIELARRRVVALPAVAIDSLMHFYMMCIALGETPFTTIGRVVDRQAGIAALEHLRALVALCDPACLQRNPIQTYEALAVGDTLAYCPFAYGYSNYARSGYAANRLRFGGLATFDSQRLRSTLGGAGLAVSAACRHVDIAVAFARFVADPAVQCGIYVASGGQPGYRAAWEDDLANTICDGYFRDTLPTLDAAFLRPRYAGYTWFQDHAAPLVRACLTGERSATAVMDDLDRLYHDSLVSGKGA